MIKIVIDNDIKVYGLEQTKELMRILNKEFTFPNPEITKRKKLNLNVYGIPKTIFLYDKNLEYFTFNRGDIYKIEKLLGSLKKEYTILDHTEPGRNCKFSWDKATVLRDYQKDVMYQVEKLDCGTIIAPAGSGKTVMGMKLIDIVGKKTLWVTHTVDLVSQSAIKAEILLDCKVTKVCGAKKDITGDVVVATVQTLIRNPTIVMQLNKSIGMIIVDEAHHTPAKMFEEVVTKFKTKKIFGLTATPKRSDGLEPILYSIVGEKAAQVHRKDLHEDNRLILPELRVVYTDFHYDDIGLGNNSVNLGGEKGVFNYSKLVNALTDDEDRKQLIVDTIAENYEGKKSLCVSEWIAYLLEIKDKLSDRLPGARIECIHGKIKNVDRDNILDEFRAGNIDILLASSIAREGLDLPNLNQLFLMTPKRGDAIIEQEVGRVQRSDPSDPFKLSTVFDFVDHKNSIFKNQFGKRKKVYKRLGIAIPVKKRDTSTNFVDEILKDMGLEV